MEKPIITAENTELVLDKKFVRVYDLQYAPGRHYYDASRRPKEELVALKSQEDYQTLLPDAVSCIVILAPEGKDPKILLSWEFRYPAGQFLLSVPAGLIDPADKAGKEPLLATARREIREETGLILTEEDTLSVANPFLFSTPGMTDESNALVCAVIHSFDASHLSQEGAEGSECFDGFVMLDREEALRTMRQGRDDNGIYYSIFTWAALNYFVSDLWRE